MKHASLIRCWALIGVASAAVLFGGCRRGNEGGGRAQAPPPSAEAPAAQTNRVDIPAPVRQNLGITFARAEYRNVARTLRVPGRFEYLPTARREYRAALGGRVELRVSQYQPVRAGAGLYRVDSPAFRDLHERIAATRAEVESMPPIREAHRVHEKSLAEKVALWQDRLRQLERLREAGGGSAAQFTEARAALNATQAELADVMEKDAELQSQHRRAEAALRALVARVSALDRSSGCSIAPVDESDADGYTVCAAEHGVIESVHTTQGGLVDENGLVLTVVQPDRLRFRARALQSDLGRLRDGLRARVAPPHDGSAGVQGPVEGVLQVGLSADPDGRTIDLVLVSDSVAPWARAGVSAEMEVTLEGGSEELAIPLAAVVRDGAQPIIFRRDPANPDRVIRTPADLGIHDGRWVVVSSGVKEGDEIVVTGNDQLMLATSGNAARGGHFHPDGTFHEGDH